MAHVNYSSYHYRVFGTRLDPIIRITVRVIIVSERPLLSSEHAIALLQSWFTVRKREIWEEYYKGTGTNSNWPITGQHFRRVSCDVLWWRFWRCRITDQSQAPPIGGIPSRGNKIEVECIRTWTRTVGPQGRHPPCRGNYIL